MDELFDLVIQAQNGDREAVYEVIKIILPAIKSVRNKIEHNNRDDLEQEIMATLIKKILSYDLTQIPDFSTFFIVLQKPQSYYKS
ncbi:helix-turn-helix domain-containing protein [Paenibacillus bouchesdurhonensis]|uniref:helix-turn-helix domain-containing protein n=1 Tax=Paenibacillus bouchesdurhonensis TaxID=1870990 RepID=UPI0019028B99|nr:helix-turn-helix domain-containing protein [Paenibacillus bouchesdurhonensis]